LFLFAAGAEGAAAGAAAIDAAAVEATWAAGKIPEKRLGNFLPSKYFAALGLSSK
jgi:hypothetical protein